MIKQEKNYLSRKKKQHFLRSLIWIAIIIIFFSIGWMITELRANYYTLLAAVLTLPLALNITRYIVYRRFKDPSTKKASCLERMKGEYHLYHAVLIPDANSVLFFEHVILTSRSIYFISENEEMLLKARSLLPLRLEKKGVQKERLHFNLGSEFQAVKNIAIRIQKDACYTNEQLDQYTQVIESMIM